MIEPDLTAVPLFKNFSPEALATLTTRLTRAACRAGEAIFLANEPGDAMYIVSSGRVRIWVYDDDSNPVTLSELGPGSFFGEMAVIDRGTRSANASAIDDCALACLTRDAFEGVLLAHPQAALEVLRSFGARLRQTNQLVAQRGTRNANEIHERSLSPLDRLAMAITDKVGSVGFFLMIATWTILWTGYNMLASLVPALHWVAFDPFPAFVAYLLISNVIQIMLMPLIMVGQNLQGRHSETRAELDFEINQKAEKEVMATLLHLDRNTDLLLKLMRHLEFQLSPSELEVIASERAFSRSVTTPGPIGR